MTQRRRNSKKSFKNYPPRNKVAYDLSKARKEAQTERKKTPKGKKRKRMRKTQMGKPPKKKAKTKKGRQAAGGKDNGGFAPALN